MEKYQINIAIVIIGRNEGERLKRCLKSVCALDVPAVYVDSASSDDSISYSKSAGIDFIELDNSVPLSAARARNAGFDWINRSLGGAKYIQFIDGDCELDPDWLNVAIKHLDENETVGAVCGRLREKNRDKSIFTRMSDMSWYIEPGEIEACGGIVTIRSEVFKKLGGFDASLIAGEEPEYYLRLRNEGYKVVCLEQKMAIHDGDINSYQQWFIRSCRTGFAYAQAKEWGAWQKERRSMIIWGGVFPLVIFCSFLTHPLAGVFVSLLYPVQILRTYVHLKIPYSSRDRLLLATFFMIDKFSEFFGYLKYLSVKWRGKNQTLIEYKKNTDDEK